jgi:hypothetical protein
MVGELMVGIGYLEWSQFPDKRRSLVEKSKFLTANCRAGRTSLVPSMNQDTNFFCKFVWKIVYVFEIYDTW